MKHHHHQQQQHDDTNLPLISNARIIEYLVPTMSKGLLSMFPDNSSSPCPDFDHSKSSIWSPLVPRHYVSSLDPYIGGNRRGCDGKTKKIHGFGGFELRLGSAKRKTKKRRLISSEDADAEAKNGGRGCIPFSGKVISTVISLVISSMFLMVLFEFYSKS